MTDDLFIKNSLEYNLFYLRIMGEHIVLLVGALPDINEDLKEEGKYLYKSFNEHLKKGLDYALNNLHEIGNDAVTKYTLKAEQKTISLTGFPIDTSNTTTELNFRNYVRTTPTNIATSISDYNERSLALANTIITYKTKLLEGLSTCKLFMNTYPLLIDHIRREAYTFMNVLSKLQNRDNPIDTVQEAMGKELFWNGIMSEHAMFIRGLLDPSEESLFNIANETAMKFEEINRMINTTNFKDFTNSSEKATSDLQRFKTNSVEGILNCQILSMISPIIADHVLREANHYLKILKEVKSLA